MASALMSVQPLRECRAAMAALLAKKAACADAEEGVYASDVETRRQEGGEEGPLSGACGVDSHRTVGDVGGDAVVAVGRQRRPEWNAHRMCCGRPMVSHGGRQVGERGAARRAATERSQENDEAGQRPTPECTSGATAPARASLRRRRLLSSVGHKRGVARNGFVRWRSLEPAIASTTVTSERVLDRRGESTVLAKM